MTSFNLERGFKPKLEVEYLRRLPDSKKRIVLAEQLATAVGESTRFSFQRQYRWEDFVVDDNSGESLGEVLVRGQVLAETVAWSVIENGLRNEGKMIVNFSPDNPNLYYPNGVVDFWERRGETVTWSRATVDDSFNQMSAIYRDLTGEKIETRNEMLAKPIVIENGKPNDVLNLLKVVGEKVSVTQEQIKQVAEIIVKGFGERFGDGFLLNSQNIFRAYSAVMAEVKEMVSNKFGRMWRKMNIGIEKLNDYAYLPMINMVMRTFGCDFQTTVGGFVNNFFNLLNQLTGKVSEIFNRGKFNCPKCKGEIDSGKGIETCPHCGLTKQEAGSTCD